MIKRKFRKEFFAYIRKDHNFKAVVVKNYTAIVAFMLALFFWVVFGFDLVMDSAKSPYEIYGKYGVVLIGFLTVSMDVFFDYKSLVRKRRRHQRRRAFIRLIRSNNLKMDALEGWFEMIEAVSKRPDDIMEAAKREAADRPNTEIVVSLNEKEVFKVTYNSDKDQFECARTNK